MTDKAIATTVSALPPVAPQPVTEAHPMQMISAAIEKGMSVEHMKMLFELERAWKADKAREEYAADFNLAQSEMPKVPKLSENTHTRSWFEDLGDMLDLIKPIYTKYGISISFNQEAVTGEGKENWIRVVAIVLHKGGHEVPYHLDLPIDDKGLAGKANKTKIQGIGGTTSYARRYLMRMIWNMSTGDDKDGNVPVKTITADQARHFDFAIDDCGGDREAFMIWAGVSDLRDMPADKLVRGQELIDDKYTEKAARENPEIKKGGEVYER